MQSTSTTTANANPDVSFQFRFTNTRKNLAVAAGGGNVPVPLLNIGPVDKNGKALNVQESYTLTVVRRNGSHSFAENVTLGGTTFWKPADNIGNKSIPDYASYADNFMYEVSIPGCSTAGRVFVGQRKEGFVVNVAEIFDLVNTNPLGPRDGEPNSLSHKNVTSIALEVPISLPHEWQGSGHRRLDHCERPEALPRRGEHRRSERDWQDSSGDG